MKHQRLCLYIILTFTALGIFAPSCGSRRGVQEEAREEKKDTVYPLGFCTDSFELRRGKVVSGDAFTTLMSRLGMGVSQANALVAASDSVFDPRKLRADKSYSAYYSADSTSTLEYMVYEQDRINSIVFRCRPPYGAWKAAKPVEHQRRYADVTITSSLWNDMMANGAPIELILSLSDIYQWAIDFFSLQKQDRFQVIYSQTVCEGKVISVDTVYYAVFEHDGRQYPAVMADLHDGGNIYWNEKGGSMRKAFLKAPLNFKRISSGFTHARKHPITGKVRPHTGVDYAAPAGTPVVTIGDGTVISIGWAGGGGNTVKIRHNSVYTTSYMHLSRYATGLKQGQRVSQGQVIGYVGSTGSSTGPHLDFRVWKNGSPINPLRMDSPPEKPIPDQYRPLLDSTITVLQRELDSLSWK